MNKHFYGKIVGATLKRKVNGSRHFLRKPRAVCFPVHIIKEAEKQGARAIEIIDRENGTRYTTSLRYFRSKAFEIERGYGHQLCMLLEDFNSLWQLEEPDKPTGTARQLSFFWGGNGQK